MRAEDPPSATPIPAASVTPAPAALGDMFTQLEDALAQNQQTLQGLNSDADVDRIVAALPDLKQQVSEKSQQVAAFLLSNPSLQDLRNQGREWQEIRGDLPRWAELLADRVGTMDHALETQNQTRATWNENLARLRASLAPPETLARVTELLTGLDRLDEATRKRRSELLELQSQVATLRTRVSDTTKRLEQAQGQTVNRIFHQDAPPLWDSQAYSLSWSQLMDNEVRSLSTQSQNLQTYFDNQAGRAIVHLLVFLGLWGVVAWMRSRVRPWVQKDPALERRLQVFEFPATLALLFSLLLTPQLQPEAPPLLHSILNTTTLLPMCWLLGRYVERHARALLPVLMILFLSDQLRALTSATPFLARLLFLSEMTLGVVTLALYLGFPHRVRTTLTRLGLFGRLLMALTLALLTAALSNAAGFVGFGALLGDAALHSTYLTIILFALLRAMDGLAYFALATPPLNMLGVVRHHRARLLKTVRQVMAAVLSFGWLMFTLELLTLRRPALQLWNSLMGASLQVGALNISVGDVLAFTLTLYLAVLLSRLARFVLDEDIYPRVRLAPGMPYALSMTLHYAILLGGFMLALAAGGVSANRFTVLSGAFGVGLGFGMQNIVNNFVSGLILLFERPVKVGDEIKIGEFSGSLSRIGLRASILHTNEGADVIIPNGDLISTKVTNWTMNVQARQVEIKLQVSSEASTEEVVALLEKVAGSVPGTLEQPPPEVLVTDLKADWFTLEVGVSTSESNYKKVRSALLLQVQRALAKEGVKLAATPTFLKAEEEPKPAAAE